MKMSSRLSPQATMIRLSICPAAPTNGSPCRSSSAPGRLADEARFPPRPGRRRRRSASAWPPAPGSGRTPRTRSARSVSSCTPAGRVVGVGAVRRPPRPRAPIGTTIGASIRGSHSTPAAASPASRVRICRAQVVTHAHLRGPLYRRPDPVKLHPSPEDHDARRLTALLVVAFAATATAQPAGDADRAAKWEKEIAAIEKRQAENPPEKGGIVFAGSSTIRLWDLAKSFPDWKATNSGFGGSEIRDVTHFADRLDLQARAAGDRLLRRRQRHQLRPQARASARRFPGLRRGRPQQGCQRRRIYFIASSRAPPGGTKFETQSKANALVKEFCTKDDGSATSTWCRDCWARTANRGRSCTSRTGCTCRRPGTKC